MRTTCDRALIDTGVCTAWDDPPTACPCGHDPLDQATRNRRAGDLGSIRAEIRPSKRFQPEESKP